MPDSETNPTRKEEAMEHSVTNRRELLAAIERADNCDSIVCNNRDLAELGERERKRMCPTKRLSFVVPRPCPKQPIEGV